MLTNAQVSSARKAVANASSANTKISKTQLSKLVQLRGFGPFFTFCAFCNLAWNAKRRSIEKSERQTVRK